MTKPNFLDIEGDEPEVERFEYTDPLHPEKPVSIPLRPLWRGTQYYTVAERKRELVRLYVTGQGNPGGRPLQFAVGNPPHPVDVSESLFDHVALIEYMQAGESDERLDVFQLVGMADGLLYAWPALVAFCEQLNNRVFEKKGETEVEEKTPAESGEITSSPSAPVSTTITPD